MDLDDEELRATKGLSRDNYLNRIKRDIELAETCDKQIALFNVSDIKKLLKEIEDE